MDEPRARDRLPSPFLLVRIHISPRNKQANSQACAPCYDTMKSTSTARVDALNDHNNATRSPQAALLPEKKRVRTIVDGFGTTLKDEAPEKYSKINRVYVRICTQFDSPTASQRMSISPRFRALLTVSISPRRTELHPASTHLPPQWSSQWGRVEPIQAASAVTQGK